MPGPKLFGLGGDGKMMDARRTDMTEGEVFTGKMFNPSNGLQHFDLSWFCLLSTNGNYVGGTGDGGLAARFDEDNAGLFTMSWHGTRGKGSGQGRTRAGIQEATSPVPR